MSLVKTDFQDGVELEADDLNTSFQGVLDINVYNEVFTPLTDGVETSFTTASKFKSGTLRIYLAGARVSPNAGAPFFTEVLDENLNGKGFVMSVPPGSGVELIADYQQANV